MTSQFLGDAEVPVVVRKVEEKCGLGQAHASPLNGKVPLAEVVYPNELSTTAINSAGLVIGGLQTSGKVHNIGVSRSQCLFVALFT